MRLGLVRLMIFRARGGWGRISMLFLVFVGLVLVLVAEGLPSVLVPVFFPFLLFLLCLFPFINQTACDRGVYVECIREIHKVTWYYWACASLLNICLLVQIAIGAVLTALGASQAPHLAITILGAANTVMAGVLTYLKGQGLPYRLLVYLNELKRIRT